MLYREALLTAMRGILESHPRSLILGQGVSDFKGTFGSTVGLVEDFGPDRVVDTPLSEEAITGVGVGLALTGHYVVMTHIRLDFALLCMNQIVNMAAKYRYMFGGRHSVPLLIRLVVGRSWGQGAQHSQSLQSMFAHIPGLTVIMPSSSQAVLDYYSFAAGNWPDPVISIEHRLLYELDFSTTDDSASEPPWKPKVIQSGEDVTVVATSVMVLEARRAAEYMRETHGISVEVIDLGCVSTIDTDIILESLSKTRHLVVADTSWDAYGVCAEISRIVIGTDPGLLKSPVKFVTPVFTPCPTAKTLEDQFYPDQMTMVRAILETLGKREIADIELPGRESFRDYYAHFRGPF